MAGILSWLRERGTYWLGPILSKGTQAWQAVRGEKVRDRLAGRHWFLPWIDDLTSEPETVRAAYCVMLRDPAVKAAVLTKLLSVASLDLGMKSASKSQKDRDIAPLLAN